MVRFLLALMTCGLASLPALAEPPKIDRSIGKLPAFKTKTPKYGLLVFGPEGKDRVWFIYDGDTLHIDRNGNGDLTDPGEAIERKKNLMNDCYTFEVGDITRQGLTHKELEIEFFTLKSFLGGPPSNRPDLAAAMKNDANARLTCVRLDVVIPGLKGQGADGRVSMSAGAYDRTGPLILSDSAKDAPVIRFGAPFQIDIQPDPQDLQVGQSYEITLGVGTPGCGPGTFAVADYRDLIPKTAFPVLTVSYPSATPGKPPVQEQFELKHRC